MNNKHIETIINYVISSLDNGMLDEDVIKELNAIYWLAGKLTVNLDRMFYQSEILKLIKERKEFS